MSNVADTKHETEMSEADADARDVVELLAASNLLRAVAFRRDATALHELASATSRYIVLTFEQTGEVR